MEAFEVTDSGQIHKLTSDSAITFPRRGTKSVVIHQGSGELALGPDIIASYEANGTIDVSTSITVPWSLAVSVASVTIFNILKWDDIRQRRWKTTQTNR